MNPETLQLHAGDASIELDLKAGGRAVSWRVGDFELLGSDNGHPVGSGMFPMAPWAGRLRGNRCVVASGEHLLPINFDIWAIHGTVFTDRVEVIESTSDSPFAEAQLRSVLQHPWSGWVDMTWKLTEGRLHTEISVNSDGPTFRADAGWHPWFNRKLSYGNSAQWELPGARLAPRDSEGLPTGELVAWDKAQGPFDDAFQVPNGRGTLRWPGALGMTIVNSHPWFVVFDEPAGFVLMEPQTGPPNGINEPVLGESNTVSPDHPLSLVTDWYFTRETPEAPE